MQSPDEHGQTTEALQYPEQPIDEGTMVSERQRNILQQKYTDSLPIISSDTAAANYQLQQLAQLREKYKQLETDLEEKEQEIQRLQLVVNSIQEAFEQEVAIIHSGHQQEIAQNHAHFLEILAERNQLQEAYAQVDFRLQELSQHFLDAVEEEAQRLVVEALESAENDPYSAPEVVRNAIKLLETRARQNEEQHLAEALYLKQETQRISAELVQEREKTRAERQNLIKLQDSVRSQALLRQQTLETRVRERSTIGLRVISATLILLLITIQFAFLHFFQMIFSPPLLISLLAPIALCILVAFLAAYPFTYAKHIYESAPRRVKQKNKK